MYHKDHLSIYLCIYVCQINYQEAFSDCKCFPGRVSSPCCPCPRMYGGPFRWGWVPPSPRAVLLLAYSRRSIGWIGGCTPPGRSFERTIALIENPARTKSCKRKILTFVLALLLLLLLQVYGTRVQQNLIRHYFYYHYHHYYYKLLRLLPPRSPLLPLQK